MWPKGGGGGGGRELIRFYKTITDPQITKRIEDLIEMWRFNFFILLYLNAPSLSLINIHREERGFLIRSNLIQRQP